MNSHQNNSSTKAVFAYFDYAIVLLAIVANCVVLTAVIRCQLSLPANAATLGGPLSSSPTEFSSAFAGSSFFTTDDNPTHHPAFKCGANVLRTLKLAGFFTNLLNLVGMSVDHFIGVIYPMKYRYIMSRNVARLSVVAIWLVSFALAFLDIPINVVLYYGTTATAGSTPTGAAQQLVSSTSTHSSSMATFFVPPQFSKPKALKASDVNRSPRLAQASLDFPTNEFATTTQGGKRRNVDELRAVLDELEPHSANLIEEIFNTTNDDDDYIFKADKSQYHHIDSDAKQELNKMLSMLRDDDERDRDFCTFFSGGKMWFEISIIVMALFCFAFITICYGVIFNNVSKRIVSCDMPNHRTRKLILTTVMFLGAFMICWLPFMSFEFVLLLIIQNSNNVHDEIIETETLFQKFFLVDKFFNSLMMTYPLIDPIIYAVRIPAVQQSILSLFASKRCCCNKIVSRYAVEQHQRLLSRGPSIRIAFGSEASGDTLRTTSMVSFFLPNSRARVNSGTSASSSTTYCREISRKSSAASPPPRHHLFVKGPTDNGGDNRRLFQHCKRQMSAPVKENYIHSPKAIMMLAF